MVISAVSYGQYLGLVLNPEARYPGKFAMVIVTAV